MDAGWIWFIPCLHDLTMKIWKEWEAHGSWEVMPERDRSSSLLRATPPFLCLHCRSTFISPPWANKALPAGSEDVTDNTSSSRSLLSSAAVEREMKNSSFKLVRKLHLRSPRTQSLHCLSSGWTRAAGGRWSPQFSREKGQTRAELFPKKKAHNERTPFPREQSARALRPTHKSCVSSGLRNADTDRHTS